MISDLGKRLVEAYLTMVCQMMGVSEIEGYRRYQTDPKFRSGIDMLAEVALKVVAEEDDVEILNVDLFHDNGKVPPEKEDLWSAFQEGLLGQ